MKSEQLLSDRGEPDAVGGHHTQEVVEVKCSASSQLPMLGSSWPVAPPTCCAVGGLVRRSSGCLDSLTTFGPHFTFPRDLRLTYREVLINVTVINVSS
jgi:hypothetical protein